MYVDPNPTGIASFKFQAQDAQEVLQLVESNGRHWRRDNLSPMNSWMRGLPPCMLQKQGLGRSLLLLPDLRFLLPVWDCLP
jgi:hypothetical protein